MAGTPTSTCSKTTANCPGGPTNRSLVYCETDRKSTRLNSSHQIISYAVFCLKKKKKDLMQEAFRHLFLKMGGVHGDDGCFTSLLAKTVTGELVRSRNKFKQSVS